jgi:hypothetical protein
LTSLAGLGVAASLLLGACGPVSILPAPAATPGPTFCTDVEAFPTPPITKASGHLRVGGDEVDDIDLELEATPVFAPADGPACAQVETIRLIDSTGTWLVILGMGPADSKNPQELLIERYDHDPPLVIDAINTPGTSTSDGCSATFGGTSIASFDGQASCQEVQWRILGGEGSPTAVGSLASDVAGHVELELSFTARP